MLCRTWVEVLLKPTFRISPFTRTPTNIYLHFIYYSQSGLSFLCVGVSTYITPTGCQRDEEDILAVLQESIYETYIQPKPMSTGAVEVVYQSPDGGRVGLVLFNEEGDIVVSYVARFNWKGWKNTLVVDSKSLDRRWEQKNCPLHFPFPICGYVTRISVRVTLDKDDFIVSANGIEIARYGYMPELRPPITRIAVLVDDEGASRRAKLESVSVYY